MVCCCSPDNRGLVADLLSVMATLMTWRADGRGLWVMTGCSMSGVDVCWHFRTADTSGPNGEIVVLVLGG